MRHPFLRSAGSELKDPNFKNVTLLLHGDGTNGGQNNTFVDGSTNNFTITRNGNTTQGTFSPYGDNWSNYFDGTGDYLRLPSSSAFSIATSTTPFSIECWIYPTAAGGALFAEQYEISGGNVDIAISMSGSTTTVGDTTGRYIGFGWHANPNWTTAAMSNTQVALHQWTHVACIFTGSTSKIYLNGVDSTAATPTPATTWGRTGSSGNEWYVGKRWDGASTPHFTGYISNFRFVNGTAVYASNFTPSTTPLTAITNTSLLTCQSNRFRDASTNNFTITRNGDVSVQRFSPFSPTAAYAAGTIGGSGNFSASNQYLACGSNSAFAFGTGDFTVECWYYPTTTATTNQYAYVTDSVGGLCFGFENGAFVLARRSQSPFDLTYTYNVVPNQWLHLVAVRSGSTASLFLNGVRVATGTVTTNYSVTGPVQVGGFGFGYTAVGYLSNLRTVKGTAVYDPTQTTLTVPTAPLTAITNTSLLLNFTNAAILDNAMMAVPETVGNAQISTSVKKYGTGSLYFDGTGDYLSAPFDNGRVFGTGDFTIEYWINPISNASGSMVDLRSTEVGAGGVAYSDYFATGGKLGIYISGNTYVSTSTVPTGQWTHIAVSRSGTALRVFFNGIQDGSTVANSQNLVGGPLKVGVNVALNGSFNGYLDDLRITKGVARYTANFTAPTAPFPNL